ncbi:DUF4832 domain-containing protein [Symbioplanes lichenis]|uniref:DUF4832 domain-containing protein n=1 Tax=Symbioplanes lichenis TaxID=1629072 RepID=UPI0027389A66|nr:DUF4832 domain-containing protein [Actinoplanes lichenis]
MPLLRWAVAAALLLPGPAVAAPLATYTRTYASSAADFANPGRGFFTYTETHVGPDHAPLDAAALTAARVHDGRSLVYRIFYLERYQGADTIGAADLARISADFATARRAGVKLVVRFAYSADSDLDAPEARVLKHIAQLKPILTGNADILAAVQAGFVGRWGEWYYTQSFPTWAARGRVLEALLAATSATTPVQVRTPQIKRRLAPAVARVGVHDDCFLAGTDDYGTFTAADDRAWLAAQSRTALVGGETCDPSERSGWANASAELAAYHWTYLNPSFHAGVLDSWGAAGRAEASRRLGYRLRAISLTLPARVRPGATVTATIKITNDGYAAPVQNRPVRLIVITGTTRRAVTVPADVRTWQPGRTVTLTARFTAPRAATRLALSLPDPAPSLAAIPAYAIRLAGTGTWDAARGWNDLGMVKPS